MSRIGLPWWAELDCHDEQNWIAMMSRIGLPWCAELDCHDVQNWIAMCRSELPYTDCRSELPWFAEVDDHVQMRIDMCRCYVWWADVMLIARRGRCYADCHDGQIYWLPWWTDVILIPWWADITLIAMMDRCYIDSMMDRYYVDCHDWQMRYLLPWRSDVIVMCRCHVACHQASVRDK